MLHSLPALHRPSLTCAPEPRHFLVQPPSSLSRQSLPPSVDLRRSFVIHKHMAESDGWIYTHTPLKNYASIRILELLPGREGSPLACSLKEVNKNEVPYEALSYAWGAPIFSKAIREITFDAVIWITENLYEALQVLRSEVTPRILWIDALCINQPDLKEKGHQVAHMGSVFRDASRVVVWLGPRNCTRTMEILQECVSVIGKSALDKSPIRSRLLQLSTRLVNLRFFDQPW